MSIDPYSADDSMVEISVHDLVKLHADLKEAQKRALELEAQLESREVAGEKLAIKMGEENKRLRVKLAELERGKK